jgi:ATP/maltotriose-dependent transcriptional regulator MalT
MKLFGEAHGLKARMGDQLGAANSEHSLALVLLSQGRAEEARALLAKILSSTEQLGERRARAHHLDSLAMVDLVDGDQRSAQRHLADAAAIAAEVDNPSLRASVGIHQALALLASGDLAAAAAAAGDCAQQVAGAGAGLYVAVSIEHAALAACLALASGDRAAAAASAADMASRAANAEDVRYGEAASRISAAITSAADGPAPSLATLPRLLWVSGGP